MRLWNPQSTEGATNLIVLEHDWADFLEVKEILNIIPTSVWVLSDSSPVSLRPYLIDLICWRHHGSLNDDASISRETAAFLMFCRAIRSGVRDWCTRERMLLLRDLPDALLQKFEVISELAEKQAHLRASLLEGMALLRDDALLSNYANKAENVLAVAKSELGKLVENIRIKVVPPDLRDSWIAFLKDFLECLTNALGRDGVRRHLALTALYISIADQEIEFNRTHTGILALYRSLEHYFAKQLVAANLASVRGDGSLFYGQELIEAANQELRRSGNNYSRSSLLSNYYHFERTRAGLAISGERELVDWISKRRHDSALVHGFQAPLVDTLRKRLSEARGLINSLEGDERIIFKKMVSSARDFSSLRSDVLFKSSVSLNVFSWRA